MVLKIQPEIPFTFKPGQYCTIGINGFERPYSIVSSPHEDTIELCLELVNDGELTPYLWGLKEGDFVSIRPRAKGVFTLDDNYKNYFMIVTVTGIAPIISMVRNYLYNNRNSHKFYILHGASYKSELIYSHELESLARERDDVFYIPSVSRPNEKNNNGWLGEKGRVNVIFEKYIRKFSLTPSNTLIYACGHPKMIKDVKSRVHHKGYSVKEEKYWRG
ncbi:ferredoxin--NADP reductase [Desulfobacterota bacterium AH_259_B03_O07]|nr:ferredoxin--NADP reductase [Desulfobacterota bacterium AH_259_B03_O07]